MRLGVDFDGTIVVYDDAFHRHGVEHYGMPLNVPADKLAIREWFRNQQRGEQIWIEVQSAIYGLRMSEAKPAPGVRDFLYALRVAGIPVQIISHKTEYSVADSRVNLRSAAFAWLEKNDFFNSQGVGIRLQDIFFEPTREAKIQRIIAQGCTLFIDDLKEVFDEPSFPSGVERWLYSPKGNQRTYGSTKVFCDWSTLRHRVVPQQQLGRRDNETIALAVAAATNRQPSSIERLNGGANNVVSRVILDGKAYLAKLYFTHPGDTRDRLGTEFRILSFLSHHGLRSVPQPVAMSREQGVGVYEFVEGRNLIPGEVSQADVDQLADVLFEMWSLRDKSEAMTLPNASEAAFSIGSYWTNVANRLARIRAAVAEETTGLGVRQFVEEEAAPKAEILKAFIDSRARSLGVDLEVELSPAERTLSPADHGFHNALRRADGRLTFIDFEYAGWDDPAQVMANACLLPEVPLPPEFRLAFLRNFLGRLGVWRPIALRLRLIYPMLAFKWALIMLNEFLPVSGERRAFAGANEAERAATQLAKSRRQLEVAMAAASDGFFLDELLN